MTPPQLTPCQERRARMAACPFETCSASRVQMSLDHLATHLGRVHIRAGEGVPDATLSLIGYRLCTPCRNLYKGRQCPFCPHRNIDTTSASSSTTAPCPAIPHPAPSTSVIGTPLSLPSPPFSPTFDDLLKAPIPTIRHLPTATRRQFATLLGDLLYKVATNPTWEALYALFALPKLTLWAPKTRKAKSTLFLAAEIKRRFVLFEANNWEALWAEADLTVAPPKNRARTRALARQEEDSLPSSVVDSLRGLIEEGAYAKAAKHLLSKGLANVDDPDVLSKLRALHPQGAPVFLGDDYPLPLSNTDSPTAEDHEWELWAIQAVSRFPPGLPPAPPGYAPHT